MGELINLPNIGSDTEALLKRVGIETFQKLKEVGSEEAWLMIQKIDPSACYNRLLGLAGAIHGIPKKLLPPEEKARLKAFYEANKESRCGILCNECEGRDEANCKGCTLMEMPFWGAPCQIKSCCEDKKLNHCGECDDFPCHIQMTMGVEEGFDPRPRIEQCYVWREESLENPNKD